MRKIIMHIDLNAFFVRAEEIKNPDLVGKPVGIGRLGRGGIISTCSYEARRFGVRSGMPTFKAVELCPNIILLPGDYRYYSVLSISFYNFLKERFKVVERASVDECYVDMTPFLKNMKRNEVISYLNDLEKELHEELGLFSSIGIGPTKFLAKMGSDIKKPMGVTIIGVRDIPKILDPLKVEDMYMVGKKTAPRLKAMGIRTIGDLRKRLLNEEDYELINQLGKSYATYKEWLSGKGSDTVHTEYADPKSVSHSTTLNADVNTIEEIKEVLKELSDAVSLSAQKEQRKGSVVQIILKNSRFQTKNKQCKIQSPTYDSAIIYKHAVKLLYELYTDDDPIRLVGVALSKLIDPKDQVVQMTLFDYHLHEEEMRTKLIINEINRHFKEPVLKRASDVKSSKSKKVVEK